MIKFVRKNYSLKDDMLAGAILGGSTGGSLSAVNSFLGKSVKSYNSNKLNDALRTPLVNTGIGSIIGAGLGLLYNLSNRISGQSSIVKRKLSLMEDITRLLAKSGYKKDTDFTYNPNKANSLSTKVSIVISRSSDNMSLIINTINDKNLDIITRDIVKTLPNSSIVTKKVSDRWNEIYINSMPSNNNDVGFISLIADRFISRGYPVYLLEVS